MLTQDEIIREASAAGFQSEPLEQALHLIEFLNSLRSHPFLKNRVALKGGTALNLFIFDLPRLSVDIDLNYIGAPDRNTMLAEKPKIDQAVQAVCGRLGLQVRRTPTEHAGGKWRLSFLSASGRSSALDFDLNYLLRVPLWRIGLKDSRAIGSFIATQVPVLDVHELAAGKLAALFSRNAGRDLFDACSLLREVQFDPDRLRLGFIVYGGTSRRDWRKIAVEDVGADPVEVERQLLPVLRARLTPKRSEIRSWSEKLVRECRELVSRLLPLKPHEVEFLTLLNERGKIAPELLAKETEMQALIRSHPGLQWKALNVREHEGQKQ